MLAISGPKDKAGYDGTEARGGEDRLALLKGNVNRFAEPYKTALTLLSDDEPVWYIDLTHWETEPWNNCSGRVTLGGDAAHPMTFRKLSKATWLGDIANDKTRPWTRFEQRDLGCYKPCESHDICGRESNEP